MKSSNIAGAASRNIRIPAPCKENLNSATPTKDGIFCDSCQHEVVDLTKMSAARAAKILKKETLPCIIAWTDSDGAVLLPEPVSTKRRLPVLLAASLAVAACGRTAGSPVSFDVQSGQNDPSSQSDESSESLPVQHSSASNHHENHSCRHSSNGRSRSQHERQQQERRTRNQHRVTPQPPPQRTAGVPRRVQPPVEANRPQPIVE